MRKSKADTSPKTDDLPDQPDDAIDEDDEDEVDDADTVRCPVCRAPLEIGESECPHFFTVWEQGYDYSDTTGVELYQPPAALEKAIGAHWRSVSRIAKELTRQTDVTPYADPQTNYDVRVDGLGRDLCRLVGKDIVPIWFRHLARAVAKGLVGYTQPGDNTTGDFFSEHLEALFRECPSVVGTDGEYIDRGYPSGFKSTLRHVWVRDRAQATIEATKVVRAAAGEARTLLRILKGTKKVLRRPQSGIG